MTPRDEHLRSAWMPPLYAAGGELCSWILGPGRYSVRGTGCSEGYRPQHFLFGRNLGPLPLARTRVFLSASQGICVAYLSSRLALTAAVGWCGCYYHGTTVLDLASVQYIVLTTPRRREVLYHAHPVHVGPVGYDSRGEKGRSEGESESETDAEA